MLILAFTLLDLGGLLLLGSTMSIIVGGYLASPAGMVNLVSWPLLLAGAVLAVIAGVTITVATLCVGALLLVAMLLIAGAHMTRDMTASRRQTP